MKSKIINKISGFVGNDNIIYNDGVCKKCNDIYIMKDKPMSIYNDDKVYFTCKCNPEHYYLFTKKKCYDLMRYFVIHRTIKAYMRKTYIDGIINPNAFRRIEELKIDRETISSKKKNRKWRDKIYESIDRL